VLSNPSLTTGPTQAAISTAVVQIYREFTGRGPMKARTMLHDDTVVVLLDEVLTPAERTLVANGHDDLVLTVRATMQRSMRDALREAVQELTGRTVIGFMSDNQVEPDMACEVFVLSPEERAAD
jgi:uncharacterized protein YbcI